MKKILVLGAGKSSSALISHLLKSCDSGEFYLTVGDMSAEVAAAKVNSHENTSAIAFDINDADHASELISDHDLVISMLPASFHPVVAKLCLQHKKHLITPSYLSDELKEMDGDVKAAGLVFLNEMGLDPGIDHMSAMKLITELKDQGAEIYGFESFTGGLVAPESDNNPWHYKFTWNPRNVILAGQGDGGIKFIHNGRYKYIPYHKLFSRTELIEIENYGEFEGYANRDSLKYRSLYGLEDVKTMYRGTLRRPGFSSAWDVFVQIGATDDSYVIEDTMDMTHRQFINSFLKYRKDDSVELKLAYYCKIDVDSPEMQLLKWLGIFEETVIGLEEATPAQVLQKILEPKWKMEENDKDMIVMWHKFNFKDKDGNDHEWQSSLVVLGDDSEQTAMSKTVGLPIAIAAKHILDGKYSAGVCIPVLDEISLPVLEELEKNGIVFQERKN
ncbi:MAG: saccharopine dehydrogenase [Bacteroidia bacterium]|nr:saccharopine dehydrogenase [Bacteroidia bacterium]